MEKRRFIYQDPDTGVLWMGSAAENCGISFEEICRKDTPAGQPYIIVNIDDVPLDTVDFWDAWEADFSNPDGCGIGADAWFAENNGG